MVVVVVLSLFSFFFFFPSFFPSFFFSPQKVHPMSRSDTVLYTHSSSYSQSIHRLVYTIIEKPRIKSDASSLSSHTSSTDRTVSHILVIPNSPARPSADTLSSSRVWFNSH